MIKINNERTFAFYFGKHTEEGQTKVDFCLKNKTKLPIDIFCGHKKHKTDNVPS